ncbi:hypothetical protein [Pontibacter oryzae]|uniref:DUF4221 domain-containing protein n=1 Tax=Pontibacter oryzae TaxID=2304593 RepID=A0A399S862_9BACT|nr:hypothetical protein [Pontibacter oryzae]RIJ37775.1 hypothetical protein D1627_11830 [Pontibacter oryzae]
MKKSFTLTLLLVLLAQLTFAQRPFAELPIDAQNISRMLAATNSTGDVCMLTFGTINTDFVVIDGKGQAVASGAYPFNFSSGSTVLGTLGLPGSFLFFDKAQQEETKIQPYRIDRNTGAFTALASLQAVPDPKSKLVRAFNADGKLYMLFINKKTNTLYLSIFKDEQAPEVRTYALEDKHMYDRLFKNGEIQVMEPGMDQSMYSTYYINKVYTYPDSLVLTFDLFENPDAPNRGALTTELLTLDLHQDKSSFRKLPYLLTMKGLTFNSYLHQGNVYRFIITKQSLQLQVHNLATDKTQKHYYYTQEDAIGIMTAGVFRAGTANSWSPHPDTLQNTAKVLRKMGNGYPATVVQHLEAGKVQLLVGTYEVQQSKNSTVASSVGRGIASAAGPAAIPLMMAGLAMQVTSYTLADGAGVSTYFQSILTSDTKEPAQASPRGSLQDEVRDFENSLEVQKTKMGGAILYSYQGQAHYAYLDKKLKKLVITSFPK